MEEAKGSVARCVSIGEASGGEWTALLLGELSGELAERGEWEVSVFLCGKVFVCLFVFGCQAAQGGNSWRVV